MILCCLTSVSGEADKTCPTEFQGGEAGRMLSLKWMCSCVSLSQGHKAESNSNLECFNPLLHDVCEVILTNGLNILHYGIQCILFAAKEGGTWVMIKVGGKERRSCWGWKAELWKRKGALPTEMSSSSLTDAQSNATGW